MIIGYIFDEDRCIDGPTNFTAKFSREVIPLCSVFPAKLVLEAFYASHKITWNRLFSGLPKRRPTTNMVHLRHLEISVLVKLSFFNHFWFLNAISTGRISFSGLRRLDIVLHAETMYMAGEITQIPSFFASKGPLLFKVNELNVTLVRSIPLESANRESNGEPESILGLFDLAQDGMVETITTFQRGFENYPGSRYATVGSSPHQRIVFEHTTKHQRARFHLT